MTAYRRHPWERLRAVGGCDFSLYFARNRSGIRMVADALAVYSDGQVSDLILWGREGEIVWLEVVDPAPAGPHRFPEISNLRTWEERGRELL